MKNPIRKSWVVATLAALFAVGGSAQASQQLLLPPTGATYDFDETYAGTITFGTPGVDTVAVDGDIDITATTTVEVLGIETYTQECPEDGLGGTTYDVVHLHYTGTANLQGAVDIDATVDLFPTPIRGQNIGLRIRNARFDGHLWLRTSDLATVAKKREIEGAAESNAQLDIFAGGISPGPTYSTIAPVLRANQFEEYILPLEDYRWPLATSNPSYEQTPKICAFGDFYLQYDVFGLLQDTLQDTFGTVLDVNFTVTVPTSGNETLDNGERVSYIQSSEATNDFAAPASQNFYWSPEVRYIIRQEIVNLAIGGLLNLNDATLQLVDYELPAVPETRVRAIHLANDAPAVDIFANSGSTPSFSNLSFPNGTNYSVLTPGSYTFDIAPTGQGLGSSIFTTSALNLEDGKAYTAAAIGTLGGSNFAVLPLEDDRSAPAAGQIRVRAIHAAPAFGAVDVLRLGSGSAPVLYNDLAYGTAGSAQTLAAGSYQLGLDTNNDGTPEVTFTTPNLSAGSTINLFATNDDQGGAFLVAQFGDGSTARINPDVPATDAMLRAIHLSPNAGAVDIFVNGATPAAVRNLAFPNGGSFLTVDAGQNTLALAPVNAGLGAAFWTGDVTLTGGEKYTAAAVGRTGSNFNVLLLPEDHSAVTGSNIRVRAIHGAGDVGAVDIWNLSATPAVKLYDNLAFGSIGDYLTVPAAATSLGFDTNEDGTADLTFNVPALQAGSIVNVFAVSESASTVYLIAQLDNGGTVRINPETTAQGINIEIAASTVAMKHKVDLRAYNLTNAPVTVAAYSAVEIGGTFYFYPTFGTDVVALVDSFEFPNGVDTGWFELFSLQFDQTYGITVTWYAVLINLSNGQIAGDLASSTATI